MISNSYPDNGRYRVTSTPDFHEPSKMFNCCWGGSITYGSLLWELSPSSFRFRHSLGLLTGFNRGKRHGTNYNPVITASSSPTYWDWCIEGSSYRLMSNGLSKEKDTTFIIGLKAVSTWWVYVCTSVLGRNWMMMEDVDNNRSLMISSDSVMGRYVYRKNLSSDLFLSSRIAITGGVFVEPLSQFGTAISTGIRLLSGKTNTLDIGVAFTSCPSHIQVHLLASGKSLCPFMSLFNDIPICGGLFYSTDTGCFSARLSVLLHGVTFAIIPRINGEKYPFAFRIDVIF